MRVLVIGSGGREHALVKALAKSPLAEDVFALPGNPGMAEATCIADNPLDVARTVQAALDARIDFCVVTPEDPLAAGLVDAMEAAGIRCFGPTRSAARIESSKIFAKELMQRHGIPTAAFRAFDGLEEALDYVRSHSYPLVIKADGLAKGKGVVIAQTREDAEEALREMLSGRAFGESGSRVIVEEMLNGPEVSLLCLTDGQSIRPLVSSMDHKRALDGDLGLNTGGMGAVAPNPYYTQDIAERVEREILLPSLQAMRAAGCPFSGCLFVGLMLTEDGPKVLEYNARFGDPETQCVLPLIESDLMSHLLACREQRLAGEEIRFLDAHACCLVMASSGYPGSFETGFPIRAKAADAALCYAGVSEQDGWLVTAGGRVLSLTATGESLREAIAGAYQAAERVHFDNSYYRKDIGRKALEVQA